MRLLKQNTYKKVSYFGIELLVPEFVKYIFTTAQGDLYGSKDKPVIDPRCDWLADEYSYQEYIGYVDLEGMDWKDTLVEVE